MVITAVVMTVIIITILMTEKTRRSRSYRKRDATNYILGRATLQMHSVNLPRGSRSRASRRRKMIPQVYLG